MPTSSEPKSDPGIIGAVTQSQLDTFDTTNFQAEVIGRRGLTLVDFSADGCVPCRQLGKQLVQLAAEMPPEVHFGQVNVRDNPELVARYGICSVPTLLFVKDGTVV